MSARSIQKQMRVTPADLDAIEKLGRIWGPTDPLPMSQVIRKAVSECLKREEKKVKNSPRGG